MNNPNPFVPQGSILEQQSKRRSRLKLAVFCVLVVSVAGLSAMLIQGCKREQTETADNNTPTVDTNNLATDTNAPPPDTNTAVVAPPVETNPAPVVPPVETAGTEYVVIKGDSFAKIAKKFGVKVKAVEDANPGIVPTKLKVGQKLSIPAASSTAPTAATGTDSTDTASGEELYAVRSGDTLTKIAHSHGVTVKAIESDNNLSTTKIKVGQKLKIPAKAEAAVSAPATTDTNPPPPVTVPVAPIPTK